MKEKSKPTIVNLLLAAPFMGRIAVQFAATFDSEPLFYTHNTQYITANVPKILHYIFLGRANNAQHRKYEAGFRIEFNCGNAKILGRGMSMHYGRSKFMT